jgi:hypothetical protein
MQAKAKVANIFLFIIMVGIPLARGISMKRRKLKARPANALGRNERDFMRPSSRAHRPGLFLVVKDEGDIMSGLFEYVSVGALLLFSIFTIAQAMAVEPEGGSRK